MALKLNNTGDIVKKLPQIMYKQLVLTNLDKLFSQFNENNG